MRRFRLPVLLLLAAIAALPASRAQSSAAPDSDHDGLSDALEQKLLVQFAPSFQIGRADCAGRPVEFLPEPTPTASSNVGVIYGQVSPVASQPGTVEIHYFHLWSRDCGEHGHPLDAEHVSALVRASSADLQTATWHAVAWYAAAHEHTVCDVSQIARATTLHAVDHGATVWISPDKHASYLEQSLCRAGCGADRCEQMVPLAVSAILNLGEPGHPMNGSSFIASSRWPLGSKMARSNFPPSAMTRLDALPAGEIAWFSPGRHPSQGIIAHSAATEKTLATGAANTSGALLTSGGNTADALATADDATGNALGTSYRKTVHALGTSASHVGRALGVGPKRSDPQKDAPAVERQHQKDVDRHDPEGV